MMRIRLVLKSAEDLVDEGAVGVYGRVELGVEVRAELSGLVS